MQMKITFNMTAKRAATLAACLIISACSADSKDGEHADEHTDTSTKGGASSSQTDAGKADTKDDSKDSAPTSTSKPDAGAQTASDAGGAAPSDKPKAEPKAETPKTETQTPAATARPKRYAVASYVFGDESETSYVYLVDTLEKPKLDVKQALELPGRGSIAARGKYLFVADGEAPVIRRYEISDKGEFKEAGRLDFTKYEFETIRLDDWQNIFVSDDKAYLGGSRSGNLVIWNPAMLAIEGEIDLPELTRPNLEIDSSSMVQQGKHVLFVIGWKDWDAYKTSTEQYLISIDTTTDKLADMTREERCPALANHVDRDEDGNLYFSNWIYNVTETLVSKAKSSCALRVKKDERAFDKDWILEYPTLTEGREGAGFNYYKGGHAFLSVFHAEGVKIDAMTDPAELATSANWKLWSVDLTAQKATPVEGLEPASGGYTLLEVDGHTLLTQSTEDYEKTTVFEVTGDRAFTKRFEVAGFCYQVALVP